MSRASRRRPLTQFSTADRHTVWPIIRVLHRCPACGHETPRDVRLCITCGQSQSASNRAYRNAGGDTVAGGLPRWEWRRIKGRWELCARRWGAIRGSKGHRFPV